MPIMRQRLAYTVIPRRLEPIKDGQASFDKLLHQHLRPRFNNRKKTVQIIGVIARLKLVRCSARHCAPTLMLTRTTSTSP
jgi:hypothetical protein